MAAEAFIDSSDIPRIIFIAVIIVVTIHLCWLQTYVPLIPDPQTPIIKVNNLLVSNFMVSDSNLIANWLANITIYNPNVVLSINVEQTEASILYKRDYALSLTSFDDVELDPLEKRDVYIKFVTSGVEADQPIIEYPLLKEIEKDWEQGRIRFRIRLNAMTKYEIDCPGLRGRSIIMDPYSVDLDVNVEDARRRRGARNEIYDIIGHIPRDGSWLIMDSKCNSNIERKRRIGLMKDGFLGRCLTERFIILLRLEKTDRHSEIFLLSDSALEKSNHRNGYGGGNGTLRKPLVLLPLQRRKQQLAVFRGLNYQSPLGTNTLSITFSDRLFPKIKPRRKRGHCLSPEKNLLLNPCLRASSLTDAEVGGKLDVEEVAQGYAMTQFCDKIIDVFLNEKPRVKDWKKYLILREEWNTYRESFYSRCRIRANKEMDPTTKQKLISLESKVKKIDDEMDRHCERSPDWLQDACLLSPVGAYDKTLEAVENLHSAQAKFDDIRNSPSVDVACEKIKSLAKGKELDSSLILLINSAWVSAKDSTAMKNEVKEIMCRLYKATKSSLKSIAPKERKLLKHLLNITDPEERFSALATAFSPGNEHEAKDPHALYSTPRELHKWIKIMLDAYTLNKEETNIREARNMTQPVVIQRLFILKETLEEEYLDQRTTTPQTDGRTESDEL